MKILNFNLEIINTDNENQKPTYEYMLNIFNMENSNAFIFKELFCAITMFFCVVFFFPLASHQLKIKFLLIF